MKIRLLIFLVLLFLSLPVLTHSASVPPLINYQGMLTDAQGQPVASGIKKLTFNIYDAVTGDGLIWGPQVFDSVPVINGMFNVILGTTDTGGRSILDVFGGDARFLGITIDSSSEITPRQQILSAPYAMHAEESADSTLLNGQTSQWHVPVGTIVAFWGLAAPDGWLLCNGEVIGVDSKYDALKLIVGSNLPDLRGVFLRGLDAGKGYDSGRTLGSYQDDAFQGHRHRMGYRGGGAAGGSLGLIAPDYINATAADSIQHVQIPINDGNNGSPRYTSETRPKNIAVNYIIKY